MKLRGTSHEDATHAIKYILQHILLGSVLLTAPQYHYLEGFSLIFLIDENSTSTTN